MIDINASHNISFMDSLHIFYPLALSSYFRISNTDALLLVLVNICSCCKLDQQETQGKRLTGAQ